MKVELKFLGAAQNVTGSRHLLIVDGIAILVDCGLYQERELQDRNWQKFPFDPKNIAAVFLTHAHLDHCGYLPKLVKEGFKGRIYCTPATADLAQLVLLDSGYIQEEDANLKRERHRQEGREGFPHKEEPLYTADDAKACVSLFTPISYDECINLGSKFQACFYNAGHVLGSAIIKVRVNTSHQGCTILFTGDLGRPNVPIIKEADIFEHADYILMESTYGDKEHGAMNNISEKMSEAIHYAYDHGGNVIIPSFALERAQEVLYYINNLRLEKKISYQRIFVDSPMASKITEVFKKYHCLFDEETAGLVQNGNSPFSLPGLCLVGQCEDSRNIHQLKESMIVIAGSGMCTGGRIKYHLTKTIQHSENIILFVGYQAKNTLGRQIVEGASEVRIYGQKYPVHAKVSKISGFSAHADRQELLQWLHNFKKPVKSLFAVHGEPETAIKFGKFIQENIGWNVQAPKYLEQVTLL